MNKLTIRMVELTMIDNQLPQAPAAELIYTRANASLPIQGSLTDDKCIGNSASGLFKTCFLGYTGCNITATPLEEAQPWRFFYSLPSLTATLRVVVADVKNGSLPFFMPVWE